LNRTKTNILIKSDVMTVDDTYDK